MNLTIEEKPFPLVEGGTLLLMRPRGFCAGVIRAIEVVELALEKLGPPVIRTIRLVGYALREPEAS